MEVPTSEAVWSLTAVALRVAQALAALSLQLPLGAMYDSTETRKPQSSVSNGTKQAKAAKPKY